MAQIGTIPAPGRPQQAKISPESGDRGLGILATALSGLGQQVAAFGEASARVEIGREQNRLQQEADAKQAREYDRRQKNQYASANFQLWQQETQQALTELERNSPSGAPGHLEKVNALLEERRKSFMDSLDVYPEDRAIYDLHTRQTTTAGLTSGLIFADTQGKEHARAVINQMSGQAVTTVARNPNGADAVLVSAIQHINSSTLKDDEKQAMIQSLTLQVREAELKANLRINPNAYAGGQSSNDVQWAGASATVRGLLRTISGRESNDRYNIIVAGVNSPPQEFTSYADHPRVYVPQADGTKSSAAGKYQILASTWDDAVRELAGQGIIVPDFSPESQDVVAAYIARRDYARYAARTGRTGTAFDLDYVLKYGTPTDIAFVQEALAPTWHGLQMKPQDFVNTYAQHARSGNAVVQSVMADERFSMLPPDTVYSAIDSAEKERQAAARVLAQAADEAEKTLVASIKNIALTDQIAAADATERAVAEGRLKSPDRILEARTALSEINTKDRNVTSVMRDLNSGAVFSYGEDNARIHDYLERTNTLTQIAQNVPAASADALRLSARLGFIPQTVQTQMLNKIKSNNATDQLYALNFFADAYATDKAMVFTGMNQQQISDVSGMIAISKVSTSPQNYLALYNQFNSPEAQTYRDARLNSPDIRDKMRDVTAETFQSALDIGEPPSPVQAKNLYVEGTTLLKNFLAMYGDYNLAMQATAAQLSASWGPSPIDGSLMKYSPTAPVMGVQRFQGGYEWIDPTARNFFGFSPETNYLLQGDERTISEVNQKKPPSYTAIFQDAAGSWQIAMGADGLPKRFSAALPEAYKTTETRLLNIANLTNREKALVKTGDTAGAAAVSSKREAEQQSALEGMPTGEIERQVKAFEYYTSPQVGLTASQALERRPRLLGVGVQVQIPGNLYFKMLKDELARRNANPELGVLP